MQDNPYQDLKLMQEGMPLGFAWKEYILYCLEKNVELLSRADTEADIFRLQGKHRLYKEMLTLPTSIRRSNENG